MQMQCVQKLRVQVQELCVLQCVSVFKSETECCADFFVCSVLCVPAVYATTPCTLTTSTLA